MAKNPVRNYLVEWVGGRERVAVASIPAVTEVPEDDGDELVLGDAPDTTEDDSLNAIGGLRPTQYVPISGSAVELDFGQYGAFDVTLTDDCTIAIVNWPADVAWASFPGVIRQDGTGGHVFTITGVAWPQGSPTMPSTALAQLPVELASDDGGATIGGTYIPDAGGTPSDTVTGETAWGISPDAGVSTEYSRGDHSHGSPAEPLGLLAIDAGTPTYDDSGDDVVVTYASDWGYDADGPYYDSTGAVSGEEAVLAMDPSTGELVVIPYNP